MKVLFTGASSFTGMNFAQALAFSGHTVIAPFLRAEAAYEGLRKERIERLKPYISPVWETPFGSEAFIELIEEKGPWDMLCHHASDVTNYKSPQFDPTAALAKNTHNLISILQRLKANGCTRLVWTGSVFEPHEGSGSDDLRAVSPYGLSKGLSTQFIEYYSFVEEMSLGKFVIPNPFGPFEEERYTYYLMKSWLSGEKPIVASPEYVRDNVPVTLLASVYARFADSLPKEKGFRKMNPSFYAESQAKFTARVAQEIRPRIKMDCLFTCNEQTVYPEPRIRVNLDPIDANDYDWSDAQFWDQYASYYAAKFGGHAVV